MFITILFSLIGILVMVIGACKQVEEDFASPFCVSNTNYMINSLKYGIIIICVGLFLGLLSMCI